MGKLYKKTLSYEEMVERYSSESINGQPVVPMCAPRELYCDKDGNILKNQSIITEVEGNFDPITQRLSYDTDEEIENTKSTSFSFADATIEAGKVAYVYVDGQPFHGGPIVGPCKVSIL